MTCRLVAASGVNLLVCLRTSQRLAFSFINHQHPSRTHSIISYHHLLYNTTITPIFGSSIDRNHPHFPSGSTYWRYPHRRPRYLISPSSEATSSFTIFVRYLSLPQTPPQTSIVDKRNSPYVPSSQPQIWRTTRNRSS